MPDVRVRKILARAPTQLRSVIIPLARAIPSGTCISSVEPLTIFSMRDQVFYAGKAATLGYEFAKLTQ